MGPFFSPFVFSSLFFVILVSLQVILIDIHFILGTEGFYDFSFLKSSREATIFGHRTAETISLVWYAGRRLNMTNENRKQEYSIVHEKNHLVMSLGVLFKKVEKGQKSKFW